MALIVYGDFNCPYSALASHRGDLLLGAGVDVEFRAVEHDRGIDAAGRRLVGEARGDMDREVAEVLGLRVPADGAFDLAIPATLPNTAKACHAFASSPTDDARRAWFRWVWSGGPPPTAPATAEGAERQARWQATFEGWEKQIVPSLVLEDGYVSRGLGALARLADRLAESSEHP